MDRSHYVYVLFRPWDGSPCYVGKGKRDRWLHHERRTKNLHLSRIIAKAGGELPKVKIRHGISEAEAFETERALIVSIGRGKLGPLVNLTDGGEGACGLRHSEQTKGKIRNHHLIYFSDPAMRAKTSVATKEAMKEQQIRLKVSVAQRKRFESKIELSKAAERARGRKQTVETKEKRAAANRGQKRSVASRAKMSAWQIGRKMSEEARARMSVAAKMRFSDPEQRAKAAEYGKIGAARRWSQPMQQGA